MSIEFRCSSCGSTLRVPDDAAGKQARCAACGAISPVPWPDEPPIEVVPEATYGWAPTPLPPAPPSQPTIGADYQNPYASSSTQTASAYSTATPYVSPAMARQKLIGPAIGMFIACAIEALGCLFGLLGFAIELVEANAGGAPEESFFLAVAVGLGLLRAVLVGIAAYQMLQLRSYVFCLVGAIACALPCGGACCLITMPIGIWAIVVLNDSHVKLAFAAREMPQTTWPGSGAA